MQIACPSCKTKITVPDEKIKPEGTKVKCGKCSKIFTVKKKSGEKAAAPEKPAADDLFNPPATPAPAPTAPPAAPAFDAASELGLGASSAPVDDDYLGGDNFGAEMDNYTTQIRQVAGRDSSMFGSSDALNGRPSKREEANAGLFDDGDAFGPPKSRAKTAQAPAASDLDSLFDAPAPAPVNKPAAAMPPKESLDDLFGKGLDDPAEDLADKLREAKPKKTRSQDLDDLFDRGEPEPKAAKSAERDAFFNDEPAPAPPRRETPPAPKGPTAEELAATLKLEPALKEEDLPKAPAPKPAEPKPAQAKKRSFPVKAVALGVVGLLVAGGVGAAIFVPAVNKPVMDVLAGPLGKVQAMLEPAKPEAAKPAPVNLSVTVSGGRPLDGGRGDKLYVVEGRVRNDYQTSRSFIKLRGTLTAADGTVISTREIFAGNLLNDEEIRGLDRVKIDGILNRSVGGGLQNFNVPPGNDIPFQIVFYDVDQPVSSQQVEPVGSEPGS